MIVSVADTHTLIWYLYNEPRLSARARDHIESAIDNGNQIAVSSVSLVEMVYLIEKRRIPAEGLTIVAAELAIQDGLFVEIPLDLKIARTVSRVDVGQIPDMPDRIVAATALHLGVPVISRDGRIRLSSIETIW